jgi:vanillate O-demethylase ferredoxin subunit
MNGVSHSVTVLVSAVKFLTPSIKEFTLVAAPGNTLSPYTPGAHIEVQLPIAEGLTIIRHYSLVGECFPDADAPDAYRIAVEQQRLGAGGSRYLSAQVAVGATLEISAPRNDFPLLESPQYALFAAGIGITPIYTMIEALRRRGASFQLFYCARDRDSAPYAAALADLAPGSTAFYFGGRSGPNPLRLAATVMRLQPGTRIYVCGSADFIGDVRTAAGGAGIAPELVHYELFNQLAPEEASITFHVKCHRSGLEFDVPPQLSILEAFQAAGGEAIFDCRRGECGLCTTDVLGATSEIDHRDLVLSDAQKAAGRSVCICISRLKREGQLDLDL